MKVVNIAYRFLLEQLTFFQFVDSKNIFPTDSEKRDRKYANRVVQYNKNYPKYFGLFLNEEQKMVREYLSFDFIQRYQQSKVFANKKSKKALNYDQQRRLAELWKIYNGKSAFKFRAINLPSEIKLHLISLIQKAPIEMQIVYCNALNV